MDRRKFIRNAASLVTVPLLINGQAIQVFGGGGVQGINNIEGKILILIQLDGGNDGLNTLIPLNMYGNLAKARPHVILPENKIIKLSDEVGLHPEMTDIKNQFTEGQIMFIQNVGYPKPNLSHFRSKEIILSASDSKTVVSSGWLGRYLETLHPQYPNDYPGPANPHPLSITIGSSSLPACQGEVHNMGLVMQDLKTSYVSGSGDTSFPDTPYGYELQYITQIMKSTEKYLEVISDAAEQSVSLSNLWPQTSNRLADKLKVAARLIGGGLNTPFYMVNLGGFDTHSGQVSSTDTLKGQHADLLMQLSEAVSAFLDEIKLQGKADDVIGLTFTEFGRRIASNASNGTDHGEAFPIMLFGNQINPVIFGENPEIPDVVKSSANLPMKIDFRSVYASILHHWFKLSAPEIKQILFEDFDILPILKSSVSNREELNGSQTLKILAVYPNPVSQNAEIKYFSPGGKISIQLVNSSGKRIRNLHAGSSAPGIQSIHFSKQQLAAGRYFIVIENKSERNSVPVIFQ